MGTKLFHLVLCLLLCHSTLLLCNDYFAFGHEEKKDYIVYMGKVPVDHLSVESVHSNLLSKVLENSTPEESLIRRYRRSFNGFAARLTENERQKLSEMEDVVSVFPDTLLSLMTTRSWDFLGLPLNAERQLNFERDVIVGVIDTGIWPESESFSDKGLGPPPRKWKGACTDFPCNNKIIGARYYRSNRHNTSLELSARDTVGHGTHVASIVAGVPVKNASFYHLAEGTARGGVPSTRLAIYKACWPDLFGCSRIDLLAAYDDAIADGVDIISISIANIIGLSYYVDPIAIGAFHAMMHGVLVSTPAGNEGPTPGSVSNFAPWLLSVAASSIDRTFINKVVLGNNKTIWGRAINPFDTQKEFLPLIHTCDSTKPTVLKGKIMFCDDIKALAPDKSHAAGVLGVVVVDTVNLDFNPQYVLPATIVHPDDGTNISSYMEQTREPVARIYKSEPTVLSRAPEVFSFSSRGPSRLTPNILKPDIAAPGGEILAAWSPVAPPTRWGGDNRTFVRYNIMYGTSMACPHASAAAAYIKSFHPSWSPAALMSALMTTATPLTPKKDVDPTTEGIAGFAYGSGQLNPVKARDPGLVYNTTVEDYITMLCNEGYNTTLLRKVSGDDRSCPAAANGTAKDLNYPSMAYYTNGSSSFSVNFPRRVTNVGSPNSTYKAEIKSDPNINVTVSPSVLHFKSLYEEKHFRVTVYSNALTGARGVYSASIVWSDGPHNVRSSIYVYQKHPTISIS